MSNFMKISLDSLRCPRLQIGGWIERSIVNSLCSLFFPPQKDNCHSIPASKCGCFGDITVFNHLTLKGLSYL